MHANIQKTIYFVRHGQSVDNASPVFQSVHSPLSDKGERQAASIAERLKHVEFDTLVASPMERARRTAEFIAEQTHHDIVLSDLFVERIKPTQIDGKPWTDAQAKAMWQEWNKTLYLPGERVGDGENYDDIVVRADAALQYLLDRPESKIAVVTHGFFLRAMVARVLLGDTLTPVTMQRVQEYASIENTAITVVHYKDGFEQETAWRLWTLNDHSHFAE